jgi:tryptophanyl-tRNA synthetase
MTKPVILTGIRANNDLTIGNYFGSILPIIDMAKKHSDEYQINMFIPDLHSFTTPVDYNQLYDQILHNARLFVAAGLPIDHENIYLYRQSRIPAHSELTWILSCFTSFGEMSRMIQFKDKSGSMSSELTSVGLFSYPILMAADILLYNSKYVPVGEDQTQHLEFTRDIAERINKKFGDIFVIPESVKSQHEFFGKDQGLRIKDLIEPTKKMSKSDESGRGVIFLGDNPSVAAKKIMGATTDNLAEIHFDRINQPGISNLLEILALLRGVSIDVVVAEFEGRTRYGDFKAVVAAEIEEFLTEFQQRIAEVDDNAVIAKLEQSERDLTPIANTTLLRAQQAVGLRPKVN